MANNPTATRTALSDDWIDLYAASGIEVGTQLLVSIEGGNEVFLCEAVDKPAKDTENRFYLPATQKQVIVDVGSIGLWGRASKSLETVSVLVQADFIDDDGA